jgi:hypothetical protein
MTTPLTITIAYKVNAIFLCGVNVLFLFLGIFLNSLVIISLLNSQLRKKLCYFMILVLACFDLAVVVVYHPLNITETLLSWIFANTSYYPDVVYIMRHFYVFSMTALLTMTLERYLAMLYPFFHEKSVTKTRLTIVFVSMQLPFGILSLLYIAFQLNGTHKIYIELTELAVTGAVFVAIFFFNYKVFCMVEILRQREIVTLGNFNDSVAVNIQVKKSKVSLANVSTCLLSVVCLSVCYLPSVVLIILERTERVDRSDQTVLIIGSWLDTLLTANSTLNCLIFFYKNGTLRRHGIKIMEKCFCARLRYH